MKVIDVIRDCVLNPHLSKEYQVEETNKETSSKIDDTHSITQDSIFSEGIMKYKLASLNKDDKGLPLKIDTKLMQLYMRVWSSLGYYMLKELHKGNCVASLDIGYFYPSNESSKKKVIYSPTMELLEKSKCTLKVDQYNVPPSCRNVILFNLIY